MKGSRTYRPDDNEVYPRKYANVNRSGQIELRRGFVAIASTLAIALAGGLGCVPQRADSRTPIGHARCLLAVSYGVESIPQPHSQTGGIESDMATIRRMGLNTVLLKHVGADTIDRVAAAANREKLQIILPDREAHRYVMAGVPEYRTPPPWAVRPRGTVASILRAVDIGFATDEETARRIDEVAAHYAADPAAPPTLARTNGPLPRRATLVAAESTAGHGRPLMMLHCSRAPNEPVADAVRRWWWEFHDGLTRGQTGGLIVDEYWAIPGRDAALADADGGIGLERVNTIKGMAARMRHWGPMLDQLRLVSESEPADSGSHCRLVVFAKDQRRMLLVLNSSRDEYLRTTITLEDIIAGLPANRLVEVSGVESASPSAVSRARNGRITLAVDLAPGDARLYEAF